MVVEGEQYKTFQIHFNHPEIHSITTLSHEQITRSATPSTSTFLAMKSTDSILFKVKDI